MGEQRTEQSSRLGEEKGSAAAMEAQAVVVEEVWVLGG
jgi:hypothetical protein